ncbi:U3 snoRNP protein Utp20 [Coprinopsis marcescibilis]|uniref:U3 snoRNP protein Utp20 n=1 Tax=Coprinopsis marcescibilis TaxID=230819 RepID=A0A5C3L291_COPMA|nr:U3 snoRNP protein Utp20 [Coprinopsis marcescibilis]
MDDDDYDDVPQPKRFRHQSYKQQIKDVHLPSAFKQLEHEADIADNDSHFHQALDRWRQLNLAPSFLQFASKADQLSASMPLLLHHWRDIMALWVEAMEGSDDEGLRALLDLLQKMAHDLRTTIAPAYIDVLQRLLKLLARSISPAAVTTLLETFNSLFRYILVPSIHLELLEQTWGMIKATLPQCIPEIQRAMAEVWGSVLRKLKTAARTKAVTMLAAEAEIIDDASAWVLVFACKSVSQTLHTATPSIFTPLITFYLDADDIEPAFNLLRRTLTALIHHVKTAEQFTDLSNILIQQLKSESTSPNRQRFKRMLDVVTIISSVRHGTRMTEAQKSDLFVRLETWPITADLHSSLLPFVTSLYMTSEMAQWIGPGLKYLQRLWGLVERPEHDGDDAVCLELAINVHGSLAELGWGGWKMVALPSVLKATVRPNILEKEPKKLFEFLASLKHQKKLNPNEADLVWKTKIENCALGRLEALKGQTGEEPGAEINDILSLSPFFSDAILPVIVGLIELNIQTPAEHQAWIIESAIHALSKRPSNEWASTIPLSSWTKLVVERWAHSHHVLGSMVILSDAITLNVEKLPFNTAYTNLQPSILSHSRLVRLNALRFLNSKLVAVPEGAGEVLKRCLQGEEATVDIQGVRERVLRIGRVGQVVGDSQGADLCARWLIAQLKVSLRPLWSPAAAAISSLSQRFGDLVWQLVFSELQAASAPATSPTIKAGVPEYGQAALEDVAGDSVRFEEERSWRDPSAHKLRDVVARWEDPAHGQKEYVRVHQERLRFDAAAYEYQLLTALGECTVLAEKHNKELIPFFLGLLSPSTGGLSTSPVPFLAKVQTSKQKLLAWFTLFSKFSNPKALYFTSTLHDLYTFYLSHPYRPLQRIALKCILTYKSPHLVGHDDTFQALLDDTRWRDTLTLLELVNLEAQERGEVVNVLIRLLFGIMLEKRGRSRGADRRAAVLSALASCTEEELGLLIDLMLQPLGLDRNAHRETETSGFHLHQFSSNVGDTQMLGFLTLLGDLMRLLGSRLVTYWPALLGTTIDLINFAQGKIQDAIQPDADDVEADLADEVDGEEEQADENDSWSPSSSIDPKALRSVRLTGLKRFADFFRVPISFAFEPYLSQSFSSFISPRLDKFASENAQSPSALLDLLQVWSRDASQVFFLVQFDDQLLPALYDCLVAVNVKAPVVDRVFDIIEKISDHSAENADARRKVLEPHVDILLSNLAKLVELSKSTVPSKHAGPSQSLSLSLTTPLGQRHLAILSLLAPYSTSPSQAITLLHLFLPVFRKPNKQAPEKVKANILVIVRNMIHLIPDLKSLETPLWRKLFDTLSHLFLTLRTRNGRTQLVETFAQLATLQDNVEQTWLHVIAEHLGSLNAYSAKRLDEADFDKRFAAYSVFNEELYQSPSLRPLAWIPLIQQSFHDIQDGEELAVRAAAAHTLRRFIDVVVRSASENESTVPTISDTYPAVFLTTFLPGLRSLISAPLHFHSPILQSSLGVKADLLSTLSYAVAECPENFSPILDALRPLLEGGDEEANFFNNVLHIQIHRRTRAIRRLGNRSESEGFQDAKEHGDSLVVKDWLIPIVSWFVGNGEGFSKSPSSSSSSARQKPDQQQHLTTNEAIHTIGKLSRHLSWAPYYALVQRYLRLAKVKNDWERIYVRTIVSILENFGFEVSDGEEVDIVSPKNETRSDDAMDVDNQAQPSELAEEGGEGDIDEEEGRVDDDDAEVQVPEVQKPQKTRRRPKILSSLKLRLLPALLSYLSPPAHRFEEDQTPLTTRLPIAIAIARLTLYLPILKPEDRDRKKTELRRLATVLSHMMRSRSQEVRDSVRDVLGKIAMLVAGVGEFKASHRGDDDIDGKQTFEGDEYVKVLVDELTTALTRGPQLHVLVCTVQSILTKVTLGSESDDQTESTAKSVQRSTSEDVEAEETTVKTCPQGNQSDNRVFLDILVPSIAAMSSSILFGDVATSEVQVNATGQEVPTNHASAAFREPRKSVNSSYNLYGLAAQFSSPSILPDLLKDLKSVPRTTSNMKVLSVADEVLRRVGGGLERNPGSERKKEKDDQTEIQPESDWLLNVIWGLVSGNVAFLKERPEPLKSKNKKKRRDVTSRDDDVTVQTKRLIVQESDHYAHNSFRFIVLGLDLLNTAMRRGRFVSASPVIYRQLDALLPVIGNTLYSASTPVLLAALKSVSLLVTRFPAKLPGMRKALPVYVNQVMSIIRSSGGGGGNMGGTDGDLLQGALRTLGVMIRDGPKTTTSADGTAAPGVEIKEKDLSFLLELVTPDLEDPDKQNVAFTLLKAIVSRRFIVPEMYDIMEDRVAPLLVQSQSSVVREQARSLLLQFMLDYPQGKGRLQKTLAFLLRNAISYIHESGRTSILELLGAILTKFQSGLIKEYGEMIYVSLVMVMANDESAKCKELAAFLVASLYGRFDSDERNTIVRNWLRKWVKAGVEVNEAGKQKLAWVALQVWGVVVDAAPKDEDEETMKTWTRDVLEDISISLERSRVLLEATTEEQDDDSMDVDQEETNVQWQLAYYSLTALGKILRVSPGFARHNPEQKSSLVPWKLVTSHLLFPHAWVRTAAGRVLGVLFSANPLASTQPIINSPSLEPDHPFATGELRDIAAKLCDQLKSEHLDSLLALQVVKNLVWIGRCWGSEKNADDIAPAPENLVESDDEEEVVGEVKVAEPQSNLDNLPWLFSKLSYQIRGALIRRRGRQGRNKPNWTQQPLAAIRWFAAMSSTLEPKRLEQFLTHMLSPLYRVIEEETIQDEHIDELKFTAIELRDLIQQRVGGTMFSLVYNSIRQRVTEVRRERKTKRVMLGTQNPEQAGRRKEKKLKLKKESKKRKGQSFIDARGGKRRKEA